MGRLFRFYRQEAEDPSESQLLGARDRRDALKRSDELCAIDGIPPRAVSDHAFLELPGLEDFELLDPVPVRRYDLRTSHDGYVQWELEVDREGDGKVRSRLTDRASILRALQPPKTIQIGQIWTVFLAANCNVPLITVGDRYEGRLGLILTRLPARSDRMYCMLRH